MNEFEIITTTGNIANNSGTLDFGIPAEEAMSMEEVGAIIQQRPFPNEHAARLKNPADFVGETFRRVKDGTIFGSKKVPATADVIWGKLKGAAKPSDNPIPQSIRFPTKSWTVAQAKKWLKDNDVKPISFEAASGKEKSDGSDAEMMSRVLEEVHTREFRLKHKHKINDRTIEVAFSSEIEVERWFGIEVLDHSSGSVRLERLNNGAPLLLEHDRDKQIGVIESARIDDDNVGRAKLRFSRSFLGDEIMQDVEDGIRTKISMNFRIHEIHLVKKEDDKPSRFTVGDWEPLEISLVSVAADDSVGVGRSEGWEKKKEPQTTTEGRNEMAEKTNTGNDSGRIELDVGKIRQEEREAERERMSNIDETAKRFDGRVKDMASLREKAIAEGTSTDEFNRTVLGRMSDQPPIETDNDEGDSPKTRIGMTEKEIESYSLVRALHTIAMTGKLEGLEREASRAAAKAYGRSEPGGMVGFIMPHDVVLGKRALNVTDATKGGYLVGTDVLGASMIELLRNKMVIAQMGARPLAGLVGNVAIPKVTGGAVATWLPETGTATASDQAFSQVLLTPHRLVGDTAYSKELLMQASIDVEAFVRDDIMQVLAIAKDLAAINGSGNNGEPQGILNITGVNSVTFGAPPVTWSEVVSFETKVGEKSAARGALAYLTDATVRGKWKTTVKESGQAIYLWDTPANTVNGFPAFSTQQVPGSKVIFGNFNDVILADWAGIDVVVDPFSLKKTGQIEITVTLHTDIAIRHAESFTISTDSGAQ